MDPAHDARLPVLASPYAVCLPFPRSRQEGSATLYLAYLWDRKDSLSPHLWNVPFRRTSADLDEHAHQASTDRTASNIQRLTVARSRALITGICRSFARASRSIGKRFHTLATEVEHQDYLSAADPPPLLPSTQDAWESLTDMQLDL